MQRLPGTSLVTLLVAACAAVRAEGAPAESGVAVEAVRIGDGIYQFVTAPDGYVPNGNSVVVVNERDVLVFDTFSRPSTARTLLAGIRRITDKPVRYVVNSHWHPDHWSGNEVFAREFPGLEILATEDTRQLMRNTANAWPAMRAEKLRQDEAAFATEVRTGKQADGTPLTAERRLGDEEDLRLERDFTAEALAVTRTYPTLTYGDTLVLRHGGREFRFMSMVGDARGSTVLYLPAEKILVTGDLVSYPVPYFTPPLSQHARSLRTLAQLDADVIIPGHGPAWRNKDFLNQEAELLETIVRQVSVAVQRGLVTVDEIRKAVDVESLRTKFTHDDEELNAKFRRYVAGMVDNAAQEARDGKRFQ